MPSSSAGGADGNLERRPGEYVPCSARFCIGFSSFVDERVPVARVDAAGKLIRVVRRAAGEREDFAERGSRMTAAPL
jgi:hypothetical protein